MSTETTTPTSTAETTTPAADAEAQKYAVTGWLQAGLLRLDGWLGKPDQANALQGLLKQVEPYSGLLGQNAAMVIDILNTGMSLDYEDLAIFGLKGKAGVELVSGATNTLATQAGMRIMNQVCPTIPPPLSNIAGSYLGSAIADQVRKYAGKKLGVEILSNEQKAEAAKAEAEAKVAAAAAEKEAALRADITAQVKRELGVVDAAPVTTTVEVVADDATPAVVEAAKKAPEITMDDALRQMADEQNAAAAETPVVVSKEGDAAKKPNEATSQAAAIKNKPQNVQAKAKTNSEVASKVVQVVDPNEAAKQAAAATINAKNAQATKAANAQQRNEKAKAHREQRAQRDAAKQAAAINKETNKTVQGAANVASEKGENPYAAAGNAIANNKITAVGGVGVPKKETVLQKNMKMGDALEAQERVAEATKNIKGLASLCAPLKLEGGIKFETVTAITSDRKMTDVVKDLASKAISTTTSMSVN